MMKSLEQERDMTDDSKMKYKHFRNFMTNDLGVTKSDIEAWTKEAVQGEVKKLIGQLNIEDMAISQVKTACLDGGWGRNLSEPLQKAVNKAVEELVKSSLDIKLRVEG